MDTIQLPENNFNLLRMFVSVTLGLISYVCTVNAQGQSLTTTMPSLATQPSVLIRTTGCVSIDDVPTSLIISSTLELLSTRIIETTMQSPCISASPTITKTSTIAETGSTILESSLKNSLTPISSSSVSHSDAFISDFISPTTELIIPPSTSSYRTSGLGSSTLAPSFTTSSNTAELTDSSASPMLSLVSTTAASFSLTSTTTISIETTSSKPALHQPAHTEIDHEHDEHETVILGLSIGLGNAVAAVVCLLVLVLICRRRAQRNQKSSTTERRKASTDETKNSETSHQSYDTDRLDLEEEQTVYLGIVNPVHIMYEKNPDIIYV